MGVRVEFGEELLDLALIAQDLVWIWQGSQRATDTMQVALALTGAHQGDTGEHFRIMVAI